MELVKSKEICIECCPISNQLLDYTSNLSFHPALYYINNNMAVSISSDDPNLYGYDSVAYDFTCIVNCWNLNLVQLKKLVTNSIKYSSAPISKQFVSEFNSSWENWIDKFVFNKNVDLNEIVEKLIIIEFIKLKTLFNSQENHKIKINQLKNHLQFYLMRINQNIDDEFINMFFRKYLSSSFISNIINFYDEHSTDVQKSQTSMIDKLFYDKSWYIKCKAELEQEEEQEEDLAEANGSSTNVVSLQAAAVAASTATSTNIPVRRVPPINPLAPVLANQVDPVVPAVEQSKLGGKNTTMKHIKKNKHNITLPKHIYKISSLKNYKERHHNNTIKINKNK